MFYIYQQTQFHVPLIELYVEFEQHTGLDTVGKEVNVDELGDIDWEKDNNDSEGNVAAKDGEFSIIIEFGSRESVISTIKSYTISREVVIRASNVRDMKSSIDYTVYESEPQIFYAKCKEYGAWYDWLIRASLIRKKDCWEIRRYNGKHMCTTGTISQNHAKLDSDTITDAIKPLVEANSLIKVKSIIAKVQSKFNNTTLPVWLKAMTAKMPKSRVQIKYSPFIVDGTHLYKKYKDSFLVAVAQDGNQNIVPIAFAIVEGETTDAWEFFLTNLRRYVVTIDGVGIISDRHNSIDTTIGRSMMS
ncbi:uncharacterized protein LOC130934511 [Arachis stenosperma]|uniref:uncharacterized protein LOC130934511 n=1 Tax=Arachis stenosperma TaxID=217475 RepID=UPI0025ACBED8|nr:uncharacterized protein LOC130934511 [Arachis stenosperma]